MFGNQQQQASTRPKWYTNHLLWQRCFIRVWGRIRTMFHTVFYPEQCCYLIEVYFLNNKSFQDTHWLFKLTSGNHYTAPDLTINQIVRWLKIKHTITRRKENGRPSIITLEKKEVMAVVSVNCCISECHVFPRVNLSPATTHHMLSNLKLKLYRILVWWELQPTDYTKCIWLCESLQHSSHSGTLHFNSIHFSNMVPVHLDGYINSQNYYLGVQKTLMNLWKVVNISKKLASGAEFWQKKNCWTVLFWNNN